MTDIPNDTPTPEEAGDANPLLTPPRPTQQDGTLNAILVGAEARIRAVLEEAETQAGTVLAGAADDADRVGQAEQVLADADAQASQIADEADAAMAALVGQADGPTADEVRMASASLRSIVSGARPGPRLSDQVEVNDAEDVEDSDVERAALAFEGAAGAAINPVLVAIEEGIDRAAPPANQDPHAHIEALHPHIEPDVVTLAGRTFTVPGGIYTVVFVALAVLTVLEIALAEVGFLPNALVVPLLVGMSLAKAVLVVLFYMHLRTDSRLFAWALGLPLGMALLITLFLMIAPPQGY